MKTIFGVDGPVMRAMTDLMNLVILNILTALCCIPIVTAGAALSAMHYIMMQMVEQEEGSLVRTYFAQFRGNLKGSVLLFIDYKFFGSDPSKRALVIPAYVGWAILAMIFVWLFPLMARFENTCGASLRNAFLLSIANLPRTLAMMAIMAAVPFVLTQVTALLPLALFFGISLPSYLCVFLYKGVIFKMVKRAKGEDSDTNEEGA